MIRFLSLLLLGMCPCVVSVVMWSCGRLWSVCEVVVVPYVYAMVAVTYVSTVVCVACVYMARECEGARMTAMLVWKKDEVWLWRVRGMCVVRCSGIVSTVADVLYVSVAR